MKYKEGQINKIVYAIGGIVGFIIVFFYWEKQTRT